MQIFETNDSTEDEWKRSNAMLKIANEVFGKGEISNQKRDLKMWNRNNK